VGDLVGVDVVEFAFLLGVGEFPGATSEVPVT